MDALVGTKFDPAAVDKVSKSPRRRDPSQGRTRVERGTKPEHVKVVYSAPRVFEADADVTKLAYHSKHGWTGARAERFRSSEAWNFVQACRAIRITCSSGSPDTTWASPGDIGDRVRLRFDFESFHSNGTRQRLARLTNARMSPVFTASATTWRPTYPIAAAGASDANIRRRYSTFSNSVSGRQVRGIQRRDDYSAISQALGFGCFQAGGRRRVWTAGGHQITR